MRIILVAPFKDSSSGLAQFPPLGLGYVASALRAAGYRDVQILDCILERLDTKGYEDYLRRHRPQVVGVNSWSLSVREVKRCLEIAKALDPSVVTVIGGPHPSALGVEAMRYFEDADFAFRGEAEKGAPMLMDHLSGKKDIRLEDIPGLMWRKGGRVFSNPALMTPDLDTIPFPSWDLIRPERYAKAGTLIQKDTACIITTRGCPFPCTFCSAYIIAGRRLRRRSIENVMEEIRYLVTEYGIKRFVVFDENITLNHDHIKGFCKRVIEEGLGLEFELPNGIRLDTLNMEILDLMRRAGFSERVAVGIESGSERILRLMKKGLSKERIREKVRLLKRAGFKPIGYFIIGFPTETREDIEETINFALELDLYRAGFMPFHPLPGTEAYHMLLHMGELPADFDFSTLCTDNVPYAPRGITRDELVRIRRRAILRFNLRPRIIWDYMRDFNSFVFALRKFKNIFLSARYLHGAVQRA